MNSIEELNKYINLDWYLNNDLSVLNYYKVNKFAYRIFHSKKRFMHMKLDNKEKEFYQPNQVNKYINSNVNNVLELGSGQGANLYYLAKMHNEVNFIGLDINPSISKKLTNVKLLKGDFHDLSMIESNSQDIVYAFETLCYSNDKEKVFKEVNRVLKQDGIFIIFDGYSKVKRDTVSDYDKKLMQLVEKGMVLDSFEYYENLDNYAKSNDFNELEKIDLSKEVLKNMLSFKSFIAICMKFGILFKLVCKILPKVFVGNAISGYLMYEAVKENLFCYMQHIYKKEK